MWTRIRPAQASRITTCGVSASIATGMTWPRTVTSIPYDTRVYERVSTMGLVLVRPLAPAAGLSVVSLGFPDGTIAQISVDVSTRGQVLVLKKSQ